MNTWHNDSTDRLCDALLLLKTRQECYDFLEDICTIKELLDISQRLTVAGLLAKGTSYSVISRQTGASTATISRVSKCFEHGTGGYRLVLSRQNREDDNA